MRAEHYCIMLMDINVIAIVVNCLPAFAIVLRARHMPTSRRRSSKPCQTDAASQPKGHETYLLEDAASIEPAASSSMCSWDCAT